MKADIPIQKIIEDIEARFVSGNDVPVERVMVKNYEWAVIRAILVNNTQNKRIGK